MIIIDFVKEKLKKISIHESICYIFPILLIIILYFSFLPFNQTYIGEWHDIFANSMYYTLIEKNYFVTWTNLWSGGFPLIASPGSDKYYLFSFPFYLIFQNLSVVNFIILFHLLIAYFGFFKLGSLLTKNYNALLIFSLFFAFSGILLGRIYAGHHLLLYGLVWIPLLYYFFFKIVLFDQSNLINVLFLTIVSVLIYFTGNIYHFIFSYIVIFIFFIYYAITGKISRKILYYLIISVFLTILIVSIKSIPDLNVSGSIIRNDVIDPLTGGGSIENDFSSFIFGTRIDTVWAQYESSVMIGIIPLLLVIIALIYGRKDITIPSFFAVLGSIIWADGGKTIFSFLHFFPIVNSLRNPGRFFGAVLPIILFLALYGAIILCEKFKNQENLELSSNQLKIIIIGIFLLILIKLFELPFQEMITFESAISVILIGIFVILLYFQKGSLRNITYYFIFALLVNGIFLIGIYSIPSTSILIKLLFVGLLLSGLFIFIFKNKQRINNCNILCGILLAGIFLMILGNLAIGYVTIYNPELDKSLAPDVIKEINKYPSENAQLWVYETGWPIKHWDFTYWDVINNIHPMNVYAAYYLKTAPLPSYTIGNVTYYSADYIVDTQYLENGNQNIPEYTFKVQNISVFKPERVLPNIFISRDNLISPLKIEKYSPDEVIASGQILKGDIVILKAAYYPGWKANNVDTTPIGNMVGIKVSSNIDKIIFKFDPLDYKIGAMLSGVGIILAIVLYIKRDTIEKILSKKAGSESIKTKKNRKKGVN